MFAAYYASDIIAVACHAWLGPGYQVTSQVNVVNPGGAAQTAHRDYHLGFQAAAQAAEFPVHVHRLSPVLTLQGAVAHTDMPAETGPTMYLPHSQKYLPGYLAWHRPEFGEYFEASYVQLPLRKGDAVFFNPALFHAAGAKNLKGPFFLMQAVVTDLVARKAPGAIVNIISSSEHAGQPYLAPYVAAKAGLAGLTRNAAHAHRWDKIRINGLDIGWTDTEGEDATQRRFHGGGDDWRDQAGASLPMGRLGQVGEIAEFVVFLLSDHSGVVTGSVIDWDQNVLGGMD